MEEFNELVGGRQDRGGGGRDGGLEDKGRGRRLIQLRSVVRQAACTQECGCVESMLS